MKAIDNLVEPNKDEALAVDARQEIDLKVGVAFTRFQTSYFQGKYGNLDARVISLVLSLLSQVFLADYTSILEYKYLVSSCKQNINLNSKYLRSRIPRLFVLFCKLVIERCSSCYYAKILNVIDCAYILFFFSFFSCN